LCSLTVVCSFCLCRSFFSNDTATTAIYTLSLHDALPIWRFGSPSAGNSLETEKAAGRRAPGGRCRGGSVAGVAVQPVLDGLVPRSEEHTSELQSREKLVCRLLLEKKKTKDTYY